MSNDHAAFEAAYWGDCLNTFDEEQKHYVYAEHMGIPRDGYAFDAGGKSVLDIGGGPVSMLLKCENTTTGCLVVDPLMTAYPTWVRERYNTAEIHTLCARGEDVLDVKVLRSRSLVGYRYDEVWIYNVLQHTDDPALIIKNAGELALVLRLFEWIDVPAHEGHPHELTEPTLNAWIRAAGFRTSMVPITTADGRMGRYCDFIGGRTTQLAERGCYGTAYYGVFSR